MGNLITLPLIVGLNLAILNAQTIKTEDAKVLFDVNNMIINSVGGTFKGMQGMVAFNVNDLQNSAIDVCVDATTINTNNEKRDGHLRKADFFYTDKYPLICFGSSEITKTGHGFLARGELTIKGITRKVEIPFTYSDNTIRGELQLKRLDYNIGGDTGTFMVSNKIEILIIAPILNQGI